MMSGEKNNGKAVLEAVQAAIDLYGTTSDELIPILNEVNRRIGYLPKEAMEEVSKRIKLPQSKLYAVATFYRMLSTKQLGKHVIQFCESAPCHVVGGREVIQAVKDALGINEDETTPDGKWSLVTVSCLGVCGVGPVLVIDEDMYGNVSPGQISEILARYS
jgi:NADH-quinone oxidoreductase subunit E